jgi:large subunit ribosomal protein L10
MPVSKAKKSEQVENLSKEFRNISGAVVASFAKLTVAQDFELRKAVRGAGGKYRVIKNTLAERAAKGTRVEAVLQGLEGVTSIAYTEGDPVALAKALSKYVKDNPQFNFKAGVLEGKALSVKEVEALATMPSKEEIHSKLLFLINAPAQRLVTVMNAVGRDLALVVNQAVKEKKFSGGEGAGAAAAGEPAGAGA